MGHKRTPEGIAVDNSGLETIREVLRRRDNMEEDDINDLLTEAREEIRGGADPEEVLAETFGLEPDYLFDRELGVI